MSVANRISSEFSYLFAISSLRSFTSSNQMDVASWGLHARASMQAKSWTWSAVDEDVAAAQIDVPSTPVNPAKMPSVGSENSFAASAISDTRVPYALIKFGVAGQTPSNKAANFLAVRWVDPDSACSFRRFDRASPRT